jgi:hypothetical protein
MCRWGFGDVFDGLAADGKIQGWLVGAGETA